MSPSLTLIKKKKMSTNDGIRFVSSSIKIPCETMPQNDGIQFKSSSIKISCFRSPRDIISPFASLQLSNCNSVQNPFAQLLESVKTPFTQLVNSLQSSTNSAIKHTKRNPFHLKSSLLGSASLALNGPDEGCVMTTLLPNDQQRVLISEVLVRNRDGQVLERKDLENEAMTALKSCSPNSALTIHQVEEDVHRIIDSGYFSSCTPVAVDTRHGIRLVFQVEPNQEFRGLVCQGANALPSRFLEDAFRDGYGKILNLRRLNRVIDSINGWYMDRGLFGLVSGVEIVPGGLIRLQVSEAEVNDISIQFRRKTGEPTVGKTRPETILRHLTTKKGQVYSMIQGKTDVGSVLSMGIMEDVSIVPQPAGDTGKVDLIMNVVERPSYDISPEGGISRGIANSPLARLIGSCAIIHRNLFGRNHKLDLSLGRGQVDSLFRLKYTDPWIEGDNKKTSRSIKVHNSRTPGSLVYAQPDGNMLTIGRVTGGIEYSRPLRPNWSGTAGVTFQRAGARDARGNPIIRDFYSSPLTASGNAYDKMLLAKIEGVYTGSGGPSSSMLVLNMEQGLPVWTEWLTFNRVTARARKGFVAGPVSFSFGLSGGHVVGNFPPHEAFTIGGIDSVRGYEEGAIGSGRSHLVGSGEMSFPLMKHLEGVVFADCGTDLGSASTVPGDPAGTRLKPGNGYGYGVGVRLGPLRLEYAFNDQGTGRFHFGVGSRN